jgi:hypothetical protein
VCRRQTMIRTPTLVCTSKSVRNSLSVLSLNEDYHTQAGVSEPVVLNTQGPPE